MNLETLTSPTLTLAREIAAGLGMTLARDKADSSLFAVRHKGTRTPFYWSADLGDALMTARAVARDVRENRLSLGGVATRESYDAVDVFAEGVRVGFAGSDWQGMGSAGRYFAQRETPAGKEGAGEPFGPFGFGATPAAALAALRAEESAAAARESFLTSHAEPAPVALAMIGDNGEGVNTSDPLTPRESALRPRESFATFYTSPEGEPGRAVATLSRPPYLGDSGIARGLFRLTLTDGRLVAAFRHVPTLAGVRAALSAYRDADAPRFTSDAAAALSADAMANARRNLGNMGEGDAFFWARALTRAALCARRAAAYRLPRLPEGVPATLNGYAVTRAERHASGMFTVAVDLAGNTATPYAVATYWADLGDSWAWGHYCRNLADAAERFAEVAARNARRVA